MTRKFQFGYRGGLDANEYRLAVIEITESKLEFKYEPDIMLMSEIPMSGTFSGWMRNEHEARRVDRFLRAGL